MISHKIYFTWNYLVFQIKLYMKRFFVIFTGLKNVIGIAKIIIKIYRLFNFHVQKKITWYHYVYLIFSKFLFYYFVYANFWNFSTLNKKNENNETFLLQNSKNYLIITNFSGFQSEKETYLQNKKIFMTNIHKIKNYFFIQSIFYPYNFWY